MHDYWPQLNISEQNVSSHFYYLSVTSYKPAVKAALLFELTWWHRDQSVLEPCRFFPPFFHHNFIHLISHTHTLFHFLYFLQIISCKCYITNSLLLRCSIGASRDKTRQEQKSVGTVMCFLLMSFRFYCFFASCRGIYCKWNLDVDVAAAESLSIVDVFCIALT